MKDDYIANTEYSVTSFGSMLTGHCSAGGVQGKGIKILFSLTLNLLFAFCLFQPQAISQTIGVGLGKTSDGQCPAKLIVKDVFHGFGAYIKYTDNCVNFLDDRSVGLVKTESDELCIGITYQVYEMVAVFAGYGRNHTINFYNSSEHKRYLKRSKGNSVEIGANINVVTWSWGGLAIDASLNNYSLVNTLLILGIKIGR